MKGYDIQAIKNFVYVAANKGSITEMMISIQLAVCFVDLLFSYNKIGVS